MRVLRNIFRRKLRAFLTIFGIAIGVFALVVMGSIAEKLTLLVDGGVKYYQGKVVIVPKVEGASQSAASLLSIDMQRDIERVHGVAAVAAEVSARLTTETITVSFGPPAAIVGSDGKGDALRDVQDHVLGGSGARPTDHGKVAVGSDLVDKLGAKVGESVKIRGTYYEVVGIADKTLTSPDTSVYMTLKDAQELAAEDLPDVLKNSVNPATLVSDFAVYPEPGQQPDVIAAAIKRRVDGVDAYTSGRVREADQGAAADLHHDHLRHRGDLAAGRRPVGHQHHDDGGRRADPRDRHPQGDRRLGRPDHDAVHPRVRGDRAARRARRAAARAAGRRGRATRPGRRAGRRSSW